MVQALPTARRAQSEAAPPARLEYYASSATPPLGVQENAGIEEVPELLDRVRSLGVRVEQFDTADWTDEALSAAYNKAVVPAVVRHSRQYSVRRAFGTRRHGGLYFGRGVPALLVYEAEAGVPTEVYPHHEGERVVTVRDALVHILQDRRPGGRRGQLDGAAVARLREVQRRLTPVRLRDDSVAIIRAFREAR